VVPVELTDGVVALDVDVSGADGDATLLPNRDVLAAVLSVALAGSCAGVEVEETNGGACWMYDPSACTA
jgi:hypothetical protein